MEKKERNEELVELYKTGDWKHTDLAIKYGITKERVRVIIRKYTTKQERDRILYARKLNTWLKKQPK